VDVVIMHSCSVTSSGLLSAYRVEQRAHALMEVDGLRMNRADVDIEYGDMLRSGFTEWFTAARNDIVRAIHDARLALPATGTC